MNLTESYKKRLSKLAGVSEYLYHGTSVGAALGIQRDKKLNLTKANRPEFSFTQHIPYAEHYANVKGGSRPVILRTKRTDDFQISDRIQNNKGYEWVTTKEIPISDLEVRINNEWYPLENWDFIDKVLIKESEERKLGKSLAFQTKNPYVTLYRAAPIDVLEFRDKDYTTLSKQFAIDHAENNHIYHNKPFHVLQAIISTDKIFDAPNPGEYFYSGPPKKAKVIYVSKGESYDMDEENKPYHFYMLCDKLCQKEGVEVKNAMVSASKPVTREEFVQNCAYAEVMFEDQNQMLDDPTHSFHKSVLLGKPCYYMQYAGFEFIFTKDSKEKPFWINESKDNSKYFYHKSNPNNRESILKNGLIPKRGEQWLEDTPIKGKAIFATNSSKEKDWFDSTYDDDVWQIDIFKIPNIKWFLDPNFKWDKNNKHIYTKHPIPVSALTLIKKGTGKDLLK
jgi:hypothetical protein